MTTKANYRSGADVLDGWRDDVWCGKPPTFTDSADTFDRLAGILGRRCGRTDRLVSSEPGSATSRTVQVVSGGMGSRCRAVLSLTRRRHRQRTTGATKPIRRIGSRPETVAGLGSEWKVIDNFVKRGKNANHASSRREFGNGSANGQAPQVDSSASMRCCRDCTIGRK